MWDYAAAVMTAVAAMNAPVQCVLILRASLCCELD